MLKTNVLRTMGLVLWLTAGTASAAPAEPESQVVKIDSTAEAKIYRSGALRLKLNEIFRRGDQVYRVSVSFPDEATYAKVLDLGIDSLDLSRFENHISMNSDGDMVEERKMGVSLVETGAAAKRTLCADTVARGVQQLADDLWVAIDIHARLPAQQDPGDQDWQDGFDDCPAMVFSGQSCGSVCYNGVDDGDDFWIVAASCQAFPGFENSFIKFCRCA